jgi:hypothetical protein
LSDNAHGTAKAYEFVRHFSRHRFDVRIQASVFRQGATTTCWGRTSELSIDGLGATLSGQLQIGEVVSLEFPLPFPPHLMKLRAVVRYSEGLRSGFEFLVVTDQQKSILRQISAGLPPVP